MRRLALVPLVGVLVLCDYLIGLENYMLCVNVNIYQPPNEYTETNQVLPTITEYYKQLTTSIHTEYIMSSYGSIRIHLNLS